MLHMINSMVLQKDTIQQLTESSAQQLKIIILMFTTIESMDDGVRQKNLAINIPLQWTMRAITIVIHRNTKHLASTKAIQRPEAEEMFFNLSSVIPKILTFV